MIISQEIPRCPSLALETGPLATWEGRHKASRRARANSAGDHHGSSGNVSHSQLLSTTDLDITMPHIPSVPRTKTSSTLPTLHPSHPLSASGAERVHQSTECTRCFYSRELAYCPGYARLSACPLASRTSRSPALYTSQWSSLRLDSRLLPRTPRTTLKA